MMPSACLSSRRRRPTVPADANHLGPGLGPSCRAREEGSVAWRESIARTQLARLHIGWFAGLSADPQDPDSVPASDGAVWAPSNR